MRLCCGLGLLVLAACQGATLGDPAVCPDVALGERETDCPWAALARQLLALDPGQAPLGAALQRLAPELVRQLRADRELTDWHALWGRSWNVDEHAGALIVAPEILSALGAELGLALGPQLVHAGFEHTYGYLFSLLRTAYGYKRQRWVSGAIERGLGLPPGVLGPTPPAGTLFANLTYLAGRVALADSPAAQATLALHRARVVPALAAFDPTRFELTRVEERVTLDDRATSTPAQLVLRTDLLRFGQPAGADSHLLLYSLADSRQPHPVLITVFPIAAAFAASLVDPARTGDQVAIRAAYNAAPDGWPRGAELRGQRRLLPLAAR